MTKPNEITLELINQVGEAYAYSILQFAPKSVKHLYKIGYISNGSLIEMYKRGDFSPTPN